MKENKKKKSNNNKTKNRENSKYLYMENHVKMFANKFKNSKSLTIH